MGRKTEFKKCLKNTNFEGFTLLTSEQRQFCEHYSSSTLNSFEKWAFDGNLYDVYQEIFKNEPTVLEAMHDSLDDKRCTKQFNHVDVTYEQFEHFLTPEVRNNLWNINVRAACAVVKDSMQVKLLEPAKLETVDDLEYIFTNLKASSGVVNQGKSKRDSLIPCLKLAKDIKRELEKGASFDDLLIPALSFHRAQLSKFIQDGKYSPSTLKHKDRFVYGMDGGTVGVEGQYATPLIHYLSNNWFNYSGGKDFSELRSNINICRTNLWYWTGIDFSSFDQTIPSWLISECFEIIKCFFDKKYHVELEWIKYNFINTIVLRKNGIGATQKHKGIPSGSNFTQVVGSMANMIMVLSFIASLSDGKELKDKISYIRKVIGIPNSKRLAIHVMGDDDLCFSHVELDLENLSGYVNRVFGVEINPDKCDVGMYKDDPLYLKREWRHNGEYQDPMYLTVNTIHNERPRSYEGYSPWHIAYCLYLTYRLSFPSSFSEVEFCRRMEEHGGIEQLANIPYDARPGVMRPFGDKQMLGIVRSAKRLAAIRA